MNFGTKGCMYNCGDECTGECIKTKTKLVKEMIERDMYGLEEDKSEERQKQNIEKTELEISEDLLKWREERRQFNRQWENAFPPKIWPW